MKNIDNIKQPKSDSDQVEIRKLFFYSKRQ
jgi:hypothetical protein